MRDENIVLTLLENLPMSYNCIRDDVDERFDDGVM